MDDTLLAPPGARLDPQTQVILAHIAALRREMTALSGEVAATGGELAKVKMELTRYKGFVGGVVFCVGAIVTAASVMVGYFYR